MIPSFNVSGSEDQNNPDSAMDVGEVGGKKVINNSKKLTPLQAPPSSLLSVPAPGGVFPLKNSPQIASTGSATGNPRNKVALKPGFSLMDWIRLTKSGKDLTGTGGKMLKVTKKELSKHKTRKDAWMCIDGKVYNVTSYMDFHPGGWDELMKGAGKDATDLFNEVHRWVNYDSMLAACCVGKLVEDSDFDPVTSRSASGKSDAGFLMPDPIRVKAKNVIPPINASNEPTLDTFQTDTKFVVSIYTKRPDSISRENAIVELLDGNKRLKVLLQFPSDKTVFKLTCDLEHEAQLAKNKLKVYKSSGKVELTLVKVEEGRNWTGFERNAKRTFTKQSDAKLEYRKWTLKDRIKLTHDVDRIILEMPGHDDDFHFYVPVGHHVMLQGDVEGMEIARSYTPVLNNLNPLAIDRGDLHLIIKTYENGALTPYIKALEIGQEILVSDHSGDFDCHSDWRSVKQLVMLVAGTGFTPMAKLIQHFLNSKGPEYKAMLLYFNKTEEDIIWRDEIEKVSKKYPNLLYHYILSRDPDWEGAKGRINLDMLKELLPEKPGEGRCLVGVCGPKGFSDEAQQLLKRLKYSDIHLFEG